MNAMDKMVRTWKRKRQRGVSPIIATILLVAITVVLAAVLYVLISGLTHGGGAVPYSVSMGTPSWSGTSPSYGTISITGATSGLTTSLFGFAVATISGSPVPVATAAPTTTCKAKVSYATTACTAPTTGNWYVVLYYTGNGSIADIWVNGGWTTGLTNNYAVGISAGAQSLVIIGSSGASLPSSGDQLNAFGLGSSSVSGSSGSF